MMTQVKHRATDEQDKDQQIFQYRIKANIFYSTDAALKYALFLGKQSIIVPRIKLITNRTAANISECKQKNFLG